MPQRVVAHAVVAQQFQGVQQLRAPADNVANVFAGGEMIRHSDAKHLDGGHAVNVRYLWRQTFSVLALAVCEYYFSRLGPVKSQIVVLRPPVYMIQFCRSRIGISSCMGLQYSLRVVGVHEHQISSSNCGGICCMY